MTDANLPACAERLEVDEALLRLCNAMEPKIAREIEESKRYGFALQSRTLCYLALQGLMSIGIYPHDMVRLSSPKTPEAKKAEAVPSQADTASAPPEAQP